ncbi:MAG: stage II sporulation protein M [Planctomycetes bacterium]|nr:stage II sporulation protein M [Planctomycetota bacterium]
MPLPPDEMVHIARFEEKLAKASGGAANLRAGDIADFVALYRFATMALARVRDAGDDPALIRRLNAAVARGHAAIYVKSGPRPRRILELLIYEFPRRVRANRVPCAIAFFFLLGAFFASFAAVAIAPKTAYSFFDTREIEHQERMLSAPGEFRGNFIFNENAAAAVGYHIASNNIRVALLCFVTGVLILPTLYILASNGLMLGTLFGLAFVHGRTFDLYNLLMCHGTLELTAIALAGAAGMRVGLAVVAPGLLPRRTAIAQAGADAGIIAFGVAVTLAFTALIEAFVTPFAGPFVRTTVALGTGILYYSFLLLAGRNAPAAQNN